MKNSYSDINWQNIRSQFPLTRETTYLNSASRGAFSTRTHQKIMDYHQVLFSNGTKSVFELMEDVQGARNQISSFIGADAADVAFTGNSSLGMNIAANLLRGKGEVLLYDEDFPSVTLPWLNLDYEIQFFKNQSPGKITLDDIESVRTEKSKFLVISHVQYANGIRVDLDLLGDYCASHNLILVIDAAQSMGVVPINVKKQGIHILTGTGYKWACAGYGVALVYIDPKLLTNHLPLVGWKSVKSPYILDNKNSDFVQSAQSLEMGHAPFCGILALDEGLKLMIKLGLENVQNRLLYLTGYLQEQVSKAGLKLHSPTEVAHQSSISSIEVKEAEKAMQQLSKQNIIVSARGAGLRVSPHIYNNTNDIDSLMDALKA